MSNLSRTNLQTLYGTSGSTFPDNTTGEISESDMRAFGQDLTDSHINRTTDVLDEDDMASNSATAVPTQQSVKAYVDAAALGIVTSWKAPAYVATTANITLSGDQTIDGISTAGGIRVLVKNQSTATQNGIYVSSSGAWSRSSDANTAAELEGAAITVQDGSTNGNTTWIQTADGINLGVTNIEWSQLGIAATAATTTFTPAGSIAATNVQAAIQELETDTRNNLQFALVQSFRNLYNY